MRRFTFFGLFYVNGVCLMLGSKARNKNGEREDEVDVSGGLQPAKEKTGADQEHHADGNLRDHQNVRKPKRRKER